MNDAPIPKKTPAKKDGDIFFPGILRQQYMHKRRKIIINRSGRRYKNCAIMLELKTISRYIESRAWSCHTLREILQPRCTIMKERSAENSLANSKTKPEGLRKAKKGAHTSQMSGA